MMRLLLALLLVFSSPIQSEAGAFKWLARGAAVCAANSACSSAAGRGVARGAISGGEFLVKRYGREMAVKCATSPKCLSYLKSASEAAIGTGVATASLGMLDVWMSNHRGEDSGESAASASGSSASASSPDPDDEDQYETSDSKEKEPVIGRKLDFLFGKATGRAHNIERSTSMLRQLQRIGLGDTVESRELIRDNLMRAFRDPSSISKVEKGFTTRESLLMGPFGGVKLESVWFDNELISAILKGG